MAEMPWLKSHLGSLDDACSIIEQFHWNLEVFEQDGKWYVKTGEETIFKADSREEVDIFLYGMALAYDGIPSPYFERVVEDVDKWYAEVMGE